jgi:predicted Zn finger-like uncharacterized protein
MKFVCERCHTKYSIADEKVRGKVLKVRCKTCTNVITVRETGATIDDAASGGPREAPIARSGSFDAGDGPTVVGPQASLLAKVRGPLPAAALVSPGTPAAAPPPRKPTPVAPPVDTVEWYLAIDGAQTGPFPRSRLVDKILSTPTDADVHVWNAELDAWKAPKDVAVLEGELTRRRRRVTPVPPPPLHRPAAVAAATDGAHAAPVAAAAHGHAVAMETPMAAHAPDAAIAKLPAPDGHVPAPKKNGVVAPAAVAKGGHADFGIGDLLSEGGETPPPSSAMNVAVRAAAAIAPAAHRPVPAPIVAASSAAIVAASGRAKQVKLLFGALVVVAVLCGIVVFWMFRRPMATAPATEVAGTKTPPADFATLAEKLAQEEKDKKAAASAPVVSPPSVVETKPAIARIEPPQKAGKGKSKKKGSSTAPPPLSPGAAAQAGVGLNADASRFGESTGRDVRIPTSNAGAAKSTPAQADISRVINNNRQGIQTCYQRALLRDNTLTHGKVTVRVSIGLSGKVKSVSLDAPAQFRALEPCIRDVMSRWAFPPSSEEYGTEFPVVLQGNQ